jgi:hypothetical protein
MSSRLTGDNVGCEAKAWKPEKNTSGGVTAENFEVYRDGSIILASE